MFSPTLEATFLNLAIFKGAQSRIFRQERTISQLTVDSFDKLSHTALASLSADCWQPQQSLQVNWATKMGASNDAVLGVCVLMYYLRQYIKSAFIPTYRSISN